MQVIVKTKRGDYTVQTEPSATVDAFTDLVQKASMCYSVRPCSAQVRKLAPVTTWEASSAIDMASALEPALLCVLGVWHTARLLTRAAGQLHCHPPQLA